MGTVSLTSRAMKLSALNMQLQAQPTACSAVAHVLQSCAYDYAMCVLCRPGPRGSGGGGAQHPSKRRRRSEMGEEGDGRADKLDRLVEQYK